MLHRIALCASHTLCKVLKILAVAFGIFSGIGISVRIFFIDVFESFFKIFNIIYFFKGNNSLAGPVFRLGITVFLVIYAENILFDLIKVLAAYDAIDILLRGGFCFRPFAFA